MEIYTINYFGDKEITYAGTKEGAKEYAEQMLSKYLLTYEGSIRILLGETQVAEQKWNKEYDDFGEYTTPGEWVDGPGNDPLPIRPRYHVLYQDMEGNMCDVWEAPNVTAMYTLSDANYMAQEIANETRKNTLVCLGNATVNTFTPNL